MSGFSVWLSAVRPKTLGLSVSPVLLGSCLAWSEQGELHVLPALAALLAAICIQIGTNLHNDAVDTLKGTDSDDRLGPPRATAQGWLTPASVQRGAAMAFGCAFALGIYLVMVGGWPILLLGLVSLVAGAAYSGGPRPISASPLGELFVFVFFGLGATVGSYYLQTDQISMPALLSGSMLGFIAAAVLVVNNYRDMQTDAVAGRRTLAVLLPPRASQWEYALLLLAPFLLLWLLWATGVVSWWPLMLVVVVIYLILQMCTLPVGTVLNQLLAGTARFQLLFSLVFSAALFL
ncbi:1,4-dihydroxy-2-naphthoate polyprenyltransferase [Thiolapillus sp.]|uniref:1,4-dihydroxy-2-naphthoate polyprenyltransferase n=1 Tax=Thiolapillus sp. TaxID=2017437 RepID=UPI003AF486E7